MHRDCSTSREVRWQCSLNRIHNPASNSRPPISRRQSTFRFHFCNRLHCHAQSEFVLTSRPMQARVYVLLNFVGRETERAAALSCPRKSNGSRQQESQCSLSNSFRAHKRTVSPGCHS